MRLLRRWRTIPAHGRFPPLMSEIERRDTVMSWGQSFWWREAGPVPPSPRSNSRRGAHLMPLPWSRGRAECDPIENSSRGQTVSPTTYAAEGRAGIVVGLCLERSINLIVGMLGILKSGGRISAWMPIIRPSGWSTCCATARSACWSRSRSSWPVFRDESPYGVSGFRVDQIARLLTILQGTDAPTIWPM